MVAANPLSTIADSRSPLPPRVRQTLDGLLRGLGEKQIATELSISRHTVHAYVRRLYATYDVSSRSELLSRWIGSAPTLERTRRNSEAAIDGGHPEEALTPLLMERRLLTAQLARLDQRISAELEGLRRIQRLMLTRGR